MQTEQVRPDLDRQLLAKVLGMIGSAHDGEVVAAARRAQAMIQEAGLTWPDVIQPPQAAGKSAETHWSEFTARRQEIIDPVSGETLRPAVGQTWADTVRFLASRRGWQDDREQRFLDSMAVSLAGADPRHRPPITAAQAVWVLSIYRAFCARAAA